MFKKLALTAGTALVLATPAVAAPPSSVTLPATAKVKVWDALTFVAVDAEMSFGTIVRATGFTGTEDLILASDGTTNCATLTQTTCMHTTKAAEFTLNASNASDVKISLSDTGGSTYTAADNNLLLNDGSGNNLTVTLALTGATADATTADVNDYTITGSGADQTIKMHGTLTIVDSATAPSGLYTGDYNITAEYI